MSAPPDAPPTYEATMQGSAGGFAAPQDTKGYPPPPLGGVAGPPPPGMMGAPAQPPPQQVVLVVNTPNFGPNSAEMICPHCQCQIRTSTDSEPGPMAWILGGILCIIGLWPCACIPCCIDSLSSVTHKCPNCKNFLGRYKGGL